MSAGGAAMFARFAFPPNSLGYCGPDQAAELFAYGAGLQPVEPGLEQLARSFDGAWPYLDLLNQSATVDDPLALRVVEAYWLGNDLLDAVGSGAWGNHLDGRFRRRAGRGLEDVTMGVGRGAVPNHAHHVFCVYPWIGLLREGRGGAEPLRVMDRCRIRWGRVVAIDGERATVLTRPLEATSGRLSLGAPRVESATIAAGSTALAGHIVPGDGVALHWDWICQRISPRQTRSLASVTGSQLAVANREWHAARAPTYT